MMQFKLELELEFENCHNREMQRASLTENLNTDTLKLIFSYISFLRAIKTGSSIFHPHSQSPQLYWWSSDNSEACKEKECEGEKREKQQAVAVQIVKTGER